MRIAVNEARIRTATVEIKTLAISGKQVTLAVFRQLIAEEAMSLTGKWNGLPWGTVNYHPDGCRDMNPHTHLVWQKKDELRRWRFDEPDNKLVLRIEALIEGTDFWTAMDRYIPSRSAYSLTCDVHTGEVGYRPGHLNSIVSHYFEQDRYRAVWQPRVQRLVTHERHRHARWQEVRDLPQLFIAV